MKMNRQFTQFERSIDGWNRRKLLVLDADDYRNRSRFAEFVDQLRETRINSGN